MDDLIKVVSDKTGLSEELSEKAVAAVIDYLEKELPDPLSGILEKYLTGDTEISIENVADQLKDVFKFP